MKKIDFKKFVIIISAFFVFIFGITPKYDKKAEAVVSEAVGLGSLSSGATLATYAVTHPGILPFLVVGLFGVLLIGVTYENWDQIYAFGTSVASELNKLGYQVVDFVSGTTVTMNNTLKQAIYNAADNITTETLVDVNYFGTSNLISTDVSGSTTTFNYDNDMSIIIKNSIYIRAVATSTTDTIFRFNGDKPYVTTYENYAEFTELYKDEFFATKFDIIVNYEPVSIAPDFCYRRVGYGSRAYEIPSVDYTDANGDYIASVITSPVNTASEYFPGMKKSTDYKFTSVGVFKTHGKRLKITSVDLPYFGVGGSMSRANTTALVNTGYPAVARDDIVDVIFPPDPEIDEDEDVTFTPEAIITGNTTVLDFPEITDKTFEEEQERELENVLTGAELINLTARVSTLEGNLSTVQTSLNNVMSNLADLPSAIVSGIESLFSWLKGLLEQILTAILNLPSTIVSAINALPSLIATAVSAALNWIEDLPNKVVNAVSSLQTGLENLWDDLGAIWSGLLDNLVNVGNNIYNATQAMLDNLINGIESIRTWLSDVATSVWDATVSAANSITGAFENGLDLLLQDVIALVIPTDLDLEEIGGKIETLKNNFSNKFEFITVPIAKIKNIYNSPKSLYNYKITIFNQEFYPFGSYFKSAINIFRPIFNGIVVFLTLLNFYRRFSFDEVI